MPIYGCVVHIYNVAAIFAQLHVKHIYSDTVVETGHTYMHK